MKISLVRLSEGLHTLNFVEKLEKFGLEHHPNLTGGVQIQLEIEKRSPHYFLKDWVRAAGHFSCDRCLQEFDLALSGESRAVFSSDPDMLGMVGEEEIYFVSPDAKEIDITDEIRDTLLLSIPMKLLCSADCRGLCAGCGANLNNEVCRCGNPPVDPRWEGLRKLF